VPERVSRRRTWKEGKGWHVPRVEESRTFLEHLKASGGQNRQASEERRGAQRGKERGGDGPGEPKKKNLQETHFKSRLPRKTGGVSLKTPGGGKNEGLGKGEGENESTTTKTKGSKGGDAI